MGFERGNPFRVASVDDKSRDVYLGSEWACNHGLLAGTRSRAQDWNQNKRLWDVSRKLRRLREGL